MLTQAMVNAAQPQAKKYAMAAGVSGLQLIVHPTGKKTWSLAYRRRRNPDGTEGDFKMRRYMVGEHPAMTLAKARDAAERLRVKVADGADPATERKRARTDGKVSPVRTVATAVEHFIAKNQEGQALKTWDQVQWVLRKHVAGRIGDEQLRTITRGRIMQLLDDVRDENGPIMANRVLSNLKVMLRWLHQRELIPANIASDLRRPAKEPSRERVLDDGELRLAWRASYRMQQPYGELIRTLMLTGQRRGEVTGMMYVELDRDAMLWRIPADRMKMDRPHVVPLWPELLRMIDGVPRIGEFVFAVTKRGHVRGYTRLKDNLLAAMMDVLREEAAQRGEELREADLPAQFGFHDLRRTFRTRLREPLGVPEDVAEMLIAHGRPGIVGVYDRSMLLDDRRRAMGLWVQHLDSVVNPKPQLVPMAAAE